MSWSSCPYQVFYRQEIKVVHQESPSPWPLIQEKAENFCQGQNTIYLMFCQSVDGQENSLFQSHQTFFITD